MCKKYSMESTSAMNHPIVKVLRPGYCQVLETGCKANCSITLIKADRNILVDTGLPKDKDFIIEALQMNGLAVEDIDVVIGTHGHCDHVGNLNLFPHVKLVVSYDICIGDIFEDNDLDKGTSYSLCEHVKVVPTPGHTSSDISVVVSNTERGTVVVAGDLFECKEDLNDASVWEGNSQNPELQLQNRQSVLQIADYIIPGHGEEFCVPKNL